MLPDPMQSPTEDPVIAIGPLAERVGLSVSAVRKYENEGLVIAHRTEGGRRLFCYDDIARIRHIQHLIQDLRLNIEGIRRLQALVPCWDLLPCSAGARDRCPAHGEQARPCWAIKRTDGACQGNTCRRCVVYRLGSLCTDEIKPLVHAQDDGESTRPKLRELLERKRHTNTMER
jgi:MerR family transcriptional regulator, heat shock protein HspR